MERTLINRYFNGFKNNYAAWTRNLVGTMTPTEKITVSILLFLLIISGVLSFVQYINRNTKLIPQEGGIYREAAVGQPRFINPVLAGTNDLDIDITRLVYSGLFRFNTNLGLENDLASGVEISENKTEYTIALRNDVTWHDGIPFTADDVVFTIRSIKTPDYGSPLASSFRDVTIEKIDDHTIRFKLTEPYAPFLTSLTVGMVPEHVWSEIEPQNATLAEQMLKPIGTGPFKFSEISTRRRTGNITSFNLLRNEKYSGPRPYLDGITFEFFDTHDEALQSVLADKADGTGFVPLQHLKEVLDRSDITAHRLTLPQYFAVFFNQIKSESLRDAGVRAALSLATDREQIVDAALQGEGEALHLPIPPETLPDDGATPPPSFNLESARQNLEESGWKLGDEGYRYKDGKRLSFTLTTTDWPEYIATAEILQRQWREIGAEVKLEHLGTGTIQQTIIQPRDYEALLFGEILPAVPDPYPFWHSTQTRSPGLNLALFENKEVDKLLETVRKEADEGKRQEIYREFQDKILELAPAIILYRPYYIYATHGVHGTNEELAAIPAGRFNNIVQWHIKTRRLWND